MKKKLKSFLAVCLVLGLLSMPAPGVFAVSNAVLLEKEYRTAEDELSVYLTAIPGERSVESATIEVTLGGTELPVKELRSAAESSVTWYCMADVSGLSQNAGQFELEKEVLRAICKGMGESDRMVVATVGETLTPSDYMDDQDEILSFIRGLRATEEHTNLYQGIVDALAELSSSEKAIGAEATERKCLVVISDGQDYYYESTHESTSKDRADAAIREARLPVYTVAVLDDSKRLTDEADWHWRMDLATTLGSFAQESVGGVPFNPVSDGDTGDTVGRHIQSDMKQDHLLTLDLSGYEPKNDMPELELRYETAEGTVYRDSITVSAKDLLLSSPAADSGGEDTGEEEASKAAEEAGTEEAPGEEDESLLHRLLYSSDYLWLRIAVPAVFALVLAAVIFLLLRKRRRKPGAVPASPVTPAPVSAPAPASFEPELPDPIPQAPKPPAPPVMMPLEPTAPVSEPARRVVFTRVGKGGVRVELELPEDREVSLGRDRSAERILDPEDERLSGRQCFVTLHGNSLRVRDAGSRYGTFVDGVALPPNSSRVLGMGQELGAGSYRYRVSFPAAAYETRGVKSNWHSM